jgi:preprotein translocase subunit SecG
MNLTFLFFTFLAATAFFAGSLVLTSWGYGHGERYLKRHGPASLAGLGSIEAAVFALVGLLIAFSFSGALDRFDERKRLMMAEGNAIITAYDRLDMVENSRKLALKAKVKAYFGARIALYHEGIDYSFWEGVEVENPSYAAKVDTLRSEIWHDAVAACDATELKLICAMTLPPLGDMFAAARSRDGANRRHPPHAIYVTLFVLGLGSSFLAGTAMAAGKSKSWVHILFFALALALSLYIITDVEFPRLGFVRVDQFDRVLLHMYEGL